MHVVILAGGSGMRLWPLSREAFPKQFLTFFGSHSLLQETVLRFFGKYPILIVTGAPYEGLVKKQLEAIGAGCVLVLAEPARKNTAPAIALALRFLQETKQIGEEEPILVLPSDHWLEPRSVFLDCLTLIRPAVLQGKIVAFGISPKTPETGFGYIKMGVPFDSICCHIDQFVEKPSIEKAEEFLQNPKFYWNSGVLAFTSSSMWKELALHLPALAQLQHWSWSDCLKHFCFLPDISIDYGVIEKTSSAVACPLKLQWSDLGSWESIYQAFEKDSQENVCLGKAAVFDTKRSLIISKKKKVAVIGLEDVVIVDTEDALFVAKRNEAQKIKVCLEEYDFG